MPKRTRLAKKSYQTVTGRLRTEMRRELQDVSESRLRDYLQANKSVLADDPILATYHDLAKKEQERRSMLLKTWGKTSAKLPSKLSMDVSAAAEELETGTKAVKRGLKTVERRFKGLRGVLRR